MTKTQFKHRWKTFNYDRLQEQGAEVEFPPEVRGIKRTPFGQSGKGRHAPFCFADSYSIESWRDGKALRGSVSKTSGGSMPFTIGEIEEFDRSGHGTNITASIERNRIKDEDIVQLIGSKFLIDPSFKIAVNGIAVELLALEGVEITTLDINPHGQITIHFIDTSEHSRTGKLRGITWWVNRRMVGEPTWDRLDDEGAYLDGRREEAKRFSFIVEADIMKKEVKSDWRDFHADQKSQVVRETVHRFVLNKLQALLARSRRVRKLEALENSRRLLNELPTISQVTVSRFIDEVQERCPSISDRDLNYTVEILARLEESRWQYDLLKRLAECSPGDLDTWAMIMKEWTASTADLVLSELQRRLRLIERMQQLVEDPEADELHQLQPLFERGLWIFGTEYEAVDFRSNRGLNEVIRNFLGKADGAGAIEEDYCPPNKRIDLIALPDRSIGIYSADSYLDGEVSGIRKVLIVELKKGAFKLTQKEVDQARDYAKEIKRSGRVQRETEVEVIVLGAEKEEDLII